MGLKRRYNIRILLLLLLTLISLQKKWRKLQRNYWGDENVITNRPFSLGGDDFAEFNLQFPGTYAYVGSGNDKQPNTLVAHHDGLFEIDEDSLLIASKLHVAYSLSFLENLL